MFTRYGSWLLRAAAKSVASLVLVGSGVSWSGPTTYYESWNEVDVTTPIGGCADMTLVLQERLSTGLINPAFSKAGIDVSCALSDHIAVKSSLYYVELSTAGGRRKQEYEPVIATTFFQGLGRWTFADRVRVAGMLGSPSDFWVLMNQPRVDYVLTPSGDGLSVFVWDELSKYSQYSGVTRKRLALGSRAIVSKDWILNLFLLRQEDSRNPIRTINGVGFTFEARVGS